MSDRVVITKYRDFMITALIRDDRIWDILATASGEKSDFRPGDIVKAKVISIQSNLNAAFLLLGSAVKAFMELKERTDIRPEDEIVVQIVKEAFGEKEMVVTPAYSVAGKYVALTFGRCGVGVSRRIPDEKKDSLKKLLSSRLGGESRIGAVVRTNAEEAPESLILEEFEKLYKEMVNIGKKAEYSVPFIRLYSAPSEISSYLRDLRTPPDEVVTDDSEVYGTLKDELNSDEKLSGRIRLYTDRDYPLIKLCRLEAAIDEAFKKTVYLNDGGTLVIEKTEAAFIMDVNSGRNAKKLSRDKLILETNLEAVREAARQMRLRNLSGMILIDLINMSSRDHREKVIAELRSELNKDRIRAEFIDLTGLGIAEITREKRKLPLMEILSR
ncbi:MAG: ribonuclease E/G [Lachnospiraceae bacterium]|nr:ribonuclease E/G [Lachnospiraceae bacterium]